MEPICLKQNTCGKHCLLIVKRRGKDWQCEKCQKLDRSLGRVVVDTAKEKKR